MSLRSISLKFVWHRIVYVAIVVMLLAYLTSGLYWASVLD